MKRFRYPVLTAAEESGYVITCRDLPPLVTQGDDVSEVLANAANEMDEVFATYMIEGIKFPEPSKPRRRVRTRWLQALIPRRHGRDRRGG